MAASNYSRKKIEQIPPFEQLQTLLTPAIVTIVQGYAPPMTRTINGHSLENNIWLTAADVGARPNTWFPTPAEIGAQPVPGTAVENNFAMFNGSKILVDSGKNASSFLPAKYTHLDESKVLWVDGDGVVQATAQENLLDFIRPYSATKSYRENEVFHHTDPVEGRAIFTTVIPHGPNGFNSSQNLMIAKVGIPNALMQPSLINPTPTAVYTLSGNLQQLLQGLLNNIKNLQDRVGTIEGNYVESDNKRPGEKIKLNVSSTASTPQAGFHVIRIDPADILS